MLQLAHLPAVKPANCYVVGASLQVVKERVNNGETLIGWARSSNRDACPLAALACYMVWLIDIHGHTLLNTMYHNLVALEQMVQLQSLGGGATGVVYKPLWRTMYLLYGDNPTERVSYTTHNNDVHEVFNAGECWDNLNAFLRLVQCSKLECCTFWLSILPTRFLRL